MKPYGLFPLFVVIPLVFSSMAHVEGWKRGMKDCLAAGQSCKQMYEGAK